MKTIWKDIVGYENLYQINNHGIVRSMPKPQKLKGGGSRVNKGKIIKPFMTTQNPPYVAISLTKNYERKNHSIHRLLAIAFIPNPNNKPCINHINSVRSDNRLCNLEWVTYSENTKHAWDNGRMESVRISAKRNGKLNCGQNNGQSKLKPNHIIKIRKLGKIGMTQSEIGKIFNISQTCIGEILRYEAWKNIK